jgi:hypothetical protein
MSADIETDDFVGIVGAITNFVQNERIKAYNEAVDMMLDNTRAWMIENGITPIPDAAMPTLLDQIGARFPNQSPAATGRKP